MELPFYAVGFVPLIVCCFLIEPKPNVYISERSDMAMIFISNFVFIFIVVFDSGKNEYGRGICHFEFYGI